MNATTAINTYKKIRVESGVAGADPHKLICMLYEGALAAIANAKNGMLRKDISAKGAAISKALAIIDEGLNASLDKNVGGELAHNLSSLYEYMTMRLIVANLKSNTAILDEVAGLLTELKEAWDSIRPQATQTTALSGPTPHAQPAPRLQPTYGRM